MLVKVAGKVALNSRCKVSRYRFLMSYYSRGCILQDMFHKMLVHFSNT